MSDHNEYDVLDSLLDSINNDDTMEKKINDFARTKQRKKRIERARETSADFQSQYSSEARQKAKEERMNSVLSPAWKGQPSASFPKEPQADGGDTMVVSSGISQSQNTAGPVPDRNSIPDPNDGTIMFQKTEPAESENPNADHTLPVNLDDEGDDSTVYMNEDEIQNLLENDEPILKREYIRSDEGGYNPVRSGSSSKRPGPGPDRNYPSYERPVVQKKCPGNGRQPFSGWCLAPFLFMEDFSCSAIIWQQPTAKRAKNVRNSLIRSKPGLKSMIPMMMKKNGKSLNMKKCSISSVMIRKGKLMKF